MRSGSGLLLLMVLGGCVTTTDVVPMGKDSYMLSSTARGGLFAGQDRINGAKTANTYCDTMGKHMIVRRVDSNGVAGLTPVTSNFVFSCVAENDPEYQRPNFRRDPTVVVEDQR